MPINYKEIAFETAIEDSLLTDGGYVTVDRNDFYREQAVFPKEVFAFSQQTQPDLWDTLRQQHKDQFESELLETLCKALDSQGSLNVLRHGFKFYGKLVRMAYFRPASGLNPETAKLYSQNRLGLTRQLRYSTANENSIDLVISLNGIPIVTAELKNPLTGQNVEHARQQYKTDRDPRELLFQFKKRTLVHFAVDPDLVYMTTRLSGHKTSFLPFNKGNGTAAGNPENPNGHRTAYLWEDVWQRDSVLDIVARFLHLQVAEIKVGGKTINKETMVFPRYHQLDSVRKLEAAAGADGPGTNYLIEHSAGSGKSNSIGWLAHRLACLHDAADHKVFDGVIVITDRRVLDHQLQDTIYQFEHVQGVVQKIDKHSDQLAEALKSGTPIIITTLQKFPHVTDKLAGLPERKYAVILDEAHSSQSGEMAIQMKGVLAATSLEEAAKQEAQGKADYEEEIIKTILARGKQPNISFFAFTATPKHKTLEIFGTPGPDGKPHPFHLYSMRQAIQEGFILDVLKNYTTYKTYYRLIKSIEDDPKLDKKKASRALARFASFHPHNLAQKTEVIVEHFHTFTRHKIGGLSKAMVVTSSRLHAVRYKQALDAYIKDKGYTDIKTLVAFSGQVRDENGHTYTEVAMNGGVGEAELPEKFATEEYRILLVAEKYQTGFDQPLLHTIYVDKRLAGVQAVQTLSRLNRTHPGKTDTFVLDFVNDADEIQEAFQPYYEESSIAEKADPQQLYDLQARLDEAQVYHQEEVEAFCKAFFKPRPNQTPRDHALINAALDPAVERFKALSPEDQEEFRHLLGSYRNLYAFLSQVIVYQDSDLEKLYAYVRMLLMKLPKGHTGPKIEFDDEVALRYYRLQKIHEGGIRLDAGKNGEVSGPTAVGTGRSHDEKVQLSKIIEVLNDRFGTEFKPADELFFDQIREDAKADETLTRTAKANTLDNFKFVWDKALQGLVIDRLEQDEEIATRILNDQDFRKTVSDYLMPRVYEQIRNPEEQATEAASLQAEGSFFRSVTLDELAAAQGVTAPCSFDDLLGGWPEEEKDDNFEKAVADWRKEEARRADF